MRLIDRFSTHKTEARGVVTVGDRMFFTHSEESEQAQLNDFRSYVHGAYEGNGTVFACLAARSGIIGQARFAFQDESGDVMTDHPTIAKLNEDRRRLFRGFELHGSLAGNAYLQTLPGGRRRFLQPDRVDLFMEDGVVLGYEYWENGRHNGQSVPIQASEVAHYAPNADPTHPVRGMSWLQPVARKILGDEAIDQHVKSFFAHAATPNLAITFKEVVGADGLRERSKLFRDQFEGPSNSGKTLMLDNGADINTVGVNFKDMAFQEMTDRNESFVCSAAGVPPVLIGTTAGLRSSTYSNYTQAFRRFLDLTIRTEWDGITQALNHTVKAPAGSWLSYDDRRIPALQQDAKDEAEIHDLNSRTISALIRAGYEPDSAVEAIVGKDLRRLIHTGLIPITLAPGDKGLDPLDADINDPTNG